MADMSKTVLLVYLKQICVQQFYSDKTLQLTLKMITSKKFKRKNWYFVICQKNFLKNYL